MNQSNLTTKEKKLLDTGWIFVFIIVPAILILCPKERELGLVAKYDPVPVTVVEKTEDVEEEEVDIYELKSKEVIQKVNDIAYLKKTDKQEYLHRYKGIISEYSDYIDPPETLQDYFTDKQIKLLYRVVEAEATSGDFINKANVASVIFNRLNNGNFGGTLTEILSKNQFSCIKDGRYKKVKITQDTIDACEYAFMMEDTTKTLVKKLGFGYIGCLYFEKGSNVHDSYSTYAFTDSIGHKFYY